MTRLRLHVKFGMSARSMNLTFSLAPLRASVALAFVVVSGTALFSTSVGATTNPATITLSGYTTPGASSTYIATLDAPVATVPTGAATVSDGIGNHCMATAWLDDGSDGSSGELFHADCNVTNSEPGGTTATATYSGADFSAPTSNTVIIADAMSMSGTLPAPDNSNYTSTATTTLEVPVGGAAPAGAVE